jgi:hypothetical protein
MPDEQMPGQSARERLRAQHQVTLVDPAREGHGIDAQPGGTFGFTFAPAVAAPIFRQHAFRSYEMHRLVTGEAAVVGFVTPADASRLAHDGGAVEVQLFPAPDGDATEIVAITYERIRQHRQYSVRNGAGITLHVEPQTTSV